MSNQETALTVQTQPNQSNIVVLPVPISQIVNHMEQFQKLKAKLLDKTDVQGIGDKLYVKRSGWRKLALAFNISDELLKAEKEALDAGGFVWRGLARGAAPH